MERDTMNKTKKALIDDCREHLVFAIGSAAGAGEHETAARINAILVDIDIACEMCYTGKNARGARKNEEEKKMATIIRKGDEFTDESGDLRIIRIEGKHFSDYAVSIWKTAYDEDGEPLDDLVHDHDTIMTAAEIRKLANARYICYEGDEDDEDEEI